jgi:hypothetical protein
MLAPGGSSGAKRQQHPCCQQDSLEQTTVNQQQRDRACQGKHGESHPERTRDPAPQ